MESYTKFGYLRCSYSFPSYWQNLTGGQNDPHQGEG